MRIMGCFLLLAGWLIVLAALIELAASPLRGVFVAAGFATEILGLILLTQGYRVLRGSGE